MSFDRLRSVPGGHDRWILALDAKGIHVGKSFGADEPICQINAANLPDIVSHKNVVVPQLGAPGVAAHEV